MHNDVGRGFISMCCEEPDLMSHEMIAIHVHVGSEVYGMGRESSNDQRQKAFCSGSIVSIECECNDVLWLQRSLSLTFFTLRRCVNREVSTNLPLTQLNLPGYLQETSPTLL